jgi:hypothetical protein
MGGRANDGETHLSRAGAAGAVQRRAARHRDRRYSGLVFSVILEREAELVGQVAVGQPMERELAVVRALLRLIFSSDVRMPLSRLQ